jgi:hypothetical protein
VIAIDQEPIASPAIPIDILESILREHLADHTAIIIDHTSTPFAHQGTNDSTTFERVTFTWARPYAWLDSHATTWIVKHWKAGGARDGALGISQPVEALAWEQGWLRPSALPAGIVVPFIGVRRSPDGSQAWLAMTDISTELSAYPRLALSGEQVISRAKAILARLARFHALWEQPDRQAELQASRWLRHPQEYLWDLAPTYARALGRPPAKGAPLGASAPPVWDGLAADLGVFLEALPADQRRLWEDLLIDRQVLVEALQPYPRTLLHHDLDDRNIGLRWSHSGEDQPSARQPSELVLIDWEWMATGPAALDVARIVQFLPVVLAMGAAAPQAFWNNELADYYFARYRADGGVSADPALWRRSYGLALIAQSVAQMPFTHGRMLRSIRGDLPLPQIVGVSEELTRQNLRAGLPVMEKMVELATREVQRWLT